MNKLLTESEALYAATQISRNLSIRSDMTPSLFVRLIEDRNRMCQALILLARTLNGEMVACPICCVNVEKLTDHKPECIISQIEEDAGHTCFLDCPHFYPSRKACPHCEARVEDQKRQFVALGSGPINLVHGPEPIKDRCPTCDSRRRHYGGQGQVYPPFKLCKDPWHGEVKR